MSVLKGSKQRLYIYAVHYDNININCLEIRAVVAVILW